MDVTRIATGAKIQLTDGTSDATVRNLAANDALNVAIVDGAGNQVTSFAGSGGTSSARTTPTSPRCPRRGRHGMGVYQSTPTAVTDGDMGIIGIDENRRRVRSRWMHRRWTSPTTPPTQAIRSRPGDARSTALPTAVATNDRANHISDVYGRQLVGHIDPGMQVWKSGNYTTTQTSTIIWDPAAGKKIAITHLQVDSYGTTAGRIIIYFGTGAYVEGTNQPVFKGKHSPSATATPGALPPIGLHPLYSATADAELRITTDAGISLDVVCYGYEYS